MRPSIRPRIPAAHVDVFEYYWAPETEDKLNAVDTLKWVLLTDFTPLRYFADNLQQMIGVRKMSWASAFFSSLKLYIRELARVLLLYLPLAVGVGLLLNWISKSHTWGAALKNFGVNVLPYLTLTHSAILLFYFLFALMAWFGWQALAELKQHPGSPIEREADRFWFICDILVGLLFFGVALAIDLRTGSFVVANALKIIGEKHLWQPLLGAAVAVGVYYALTAYVADVAVYVNADAKSKNYAARNAILKDSTAALKGLLAYGNMTA